MIVIVMVKGVIVNDSMEFQHPHRAGGATAQEGTPPPPKRDHPSWEVGVPFVLII